MAKAKIPKSPDSQTTGRTKEDQPTCHAMTEEQFRLLEEVDQTICGLYDLTNNDNLGSINCLLLSPMYSLNQLTSQMRSQRRGGAA